jgi:gamma-glutamyltranspeptidase/glutathione hydrolase
MIRKNLTTLTVMVLLVLFLYYASYFNNPLRNSSGTVNINYSSDVKGSNGMVVSADKYASQVGLDILREGGNAVDAAVAVAFTLAVTYPQAGNIGGGGFMLIRTKDSLLTSIDFREKAPSAAYTDMFLDEKGNFVPEKSQYGYLSVGVPGSVAGLLYSLKKYGTMSRKEVLQPAIDLAVNGFKLEPELAKTLNAEYENFAEFTSSKKIFTKRKSKFEAGELFTQKDLAKTLKLIRDKGNEGFYKGVTADLIDKEMKNHGGLVTKQDLANYSPIERKPVTVSYKGFDVYSMAPPSSGGVILGMLLNMIEYDQVPDTAYVTEYGAYIHTLIECMKRAYADRSEYLGDPDFYDVKAQDLLSKQYAKERRKSISDTATPSGMIQPGLSTFYKESNQTTHFSVIDKDGNMVSVTTTLNNLFGSFVVVDGAGFLLNDEMDDFSSKPGEPNMFGLIGSDANSIQPNKRMLSSMTPTIILKDKKPFMILGSPGGGKIITAVFETVLNVIDFKLPLNLAVDKPRFHHQWYPEYVQYEVGAFNNALIAYLTSKGHVLKEVHDYGNVCAILINWDKHECFGHADRRGYGEAAAY